MGESYLFEMSGVIPAGVLGEANNLAEKLGVGPAFSSPVSVNGDEPATHYGFHSWVRESFISFLDGVKSGSIEAGLSSTEKVTLGQMVTYQGPYDEFLVTQGLKRVEGPTS